MGTLAVDGSKIRANASKRKAMSYERMQQEEKRLGREIRALTSRATKRLSPRSAPADNVPMARFLIILLIVIVIVAGAAYWSVMRPGQASAAGVPIALGLAIAAIAAGAFRFLWNPMLAPFPRCEPAPDAVRRHFQSFSIGIVNMGLSIHVAADEAYLHLTPLAIWRALGARGASIPWSEMEPIGRSDRVARVNGHRLVGPKWCMRLAGSEDA